MPYIAKPIGWWLVSALGALLLLGIVVACFLQARGVSSPLSPKHEQNLEIDIAKLGEAAPFSPVQKKVNLAVERGLAYLKSQLHVGEPDFFLNDPGAGSTVGVLALAGLTLLEGGVPVTDSVVVRLAGEVRKQGSSLRFTYALCLSILFLDRLDQAQGKAQQGLDQGALEEMSYRLLTSQNRQGGWGYFCDTLDPEQRSRMMPSLRAGTYVPGQHPGTYDDNSINQFATLALWAARRHGIKVDGALRLVEKRYRTTQNQDGSWGYRPEANNLKDATTCAGLIGLAVGRAIQEDQKSTTGLPPLARDEAVQRGLAFLTQRVSQSAPTLSAAEISKRRRHAGDMLALYKKWHHKPELRPEVEERLAELDDVALLHGVILDADAWGDLYFLWSVERVGVIYDLTKIGERDWYDWGAPMILANQRLDGSWHDRFPGIPDTCFALLFLKRANVAKDLTDKLRALLAATPSPTAPQPTPKKDD